MKCFVCDANDWHRVTVDQGGQRVPIHREATTQICKGCGSACHEVEPESEAKVKEYYRREYRPQPTVMNLTTTTHKLNYVRVFLREYLEAVGKEGKQLTVGDVGAATGYLLNFFKEAGHRVAGSELTVTYRRMSEHYYGIPLAEELEPKHRYDLITCYHVLEHLVEPDKKLAHYASLLADGGHIMLATPEWFDMLEDASGEPVRAFDYLFHKNHINLFSKTSLQNLFRKCGLRIVKEDYLQYGQTYLLAKSDSPRVDSWLSREDWREVEKTMHLQYRAIQQQVQGHFREARRIYPRFPEAWMGEVFGRNGKDLAKQVDLIQEADKSIGDNLRWIAQKGQWLYQQGRLQEAINVFKAVLSLKPNEDTYMFLGYAFSQVGASAQAIKAFRIACTMDPRKWVEANQWILNEVAKMPAWDEVLAQEAGKRGLTGDCCGRDNPNQNHAPGCKAQTPA